eukprot:1478278-Rhodomonas_salina.1
MACCGTERGKRSVLDTRSFVLRMHVGVQSEEGEVYWEQSLLRGQDTVASGRYLAVVAYSTTLSPSYAVSVLQYYDDPSTPCPYYSTKTLLRHIRTAVPLIRQIRTFVRFSYSHTLPIPSHGTRMCTTLFKE